MCVCVCVGGGDLDHLKSETQNMDLNINNPGGEGGGWRKQLEGARVGEWVVVGEGSTPLMSINLGINPKKTQRIKLITCFKLLQTTSYYLTAFNQTSWFCVQFSNGSTDPGDFCVSCKPLSVYLQFLANVQRY